MTSKLLFNVFYDEFPSFRERIYAYQQDIKVPNTIKLIFKKDDPTYKEGRFSFDGKKINLELTKK